MIFPLTVISCITCALTTFISFLLYVRARMADRSEDPRLSPAQHQQKLAALDRQEQRYQSLHFITLFLFCILGVLILIQLSNRLPPTSL